MSGMHEDIDEEKPTGDTPEAEALLDAMHAYADEVCAGWLTDMEFYLWSAVVRDGKYASDHPRAPLLRMLSEAAGGWWVHCTTLGTPREDGSRRFLTRAEWEPIYAAHVPDKD